MLIIDHLMEKGHYMCPFRGLNKSREKQGKNSNDRKLKTAD